MSRIFPSAGTAAVLAVVVASIAGSARADLDVTLGNGDKVTGTHSPAGETETFRVNIPAGARYTVSVKPKAPHVLDLRVVAPGEDVVVASDALAGPSKSVREAEQTGQYRIEVTGAGAGDYKLSIRWTNPPPRTVEGLLGYGETPFFHPVEFGGRVTVTASVPPSSPIRPRVLRWLLDAVPVGSFDPGPPSALRHTVTTGTAAETADYEFGIVDAENGAGPVAVTFKTKPPRASKRKINLTAAAVGDGDDLTSELIGPGGGSVGIDDGLSPIDGAGVNVPPGALPFPTPILIGSGVLLVPPNPNQQGAGPTIFFGPEGQQFSQPVLVTIPFDPEALGGNPSTLQIFTRDGQGNVTLVPPPYEIDVGAGTVTFPALHFSSFRAFARSSPPGDVTGDGYDDLVVFAGNLGDAVNAFPGLLVFPGGPGVRAAQAVSIDDAVARIAIPVEPGGDFAGVILPKFAVGDHDGDGDADLAVLASAGEGSPGSLRIYRGGRQFAKDVKRRRFVRIAPDDDEFHAVAAGDVDGDGRAEIFVSDVTGGPVFGGAVWVLVGVPKPDDGSVSGAPSRASAMSGATFGSRMVCADFDGDGFTELAVSAPGGASAVVEVYAGAPGFPTRFPTQAPLTLAGSATTGGGFGLELATGDVNVDGRAELAISAPNEGLVFLRNGGGLGSFEFLGTPIASGTGSFGAWMAILPRADPLGSNDRGALFVGSPRRDFGGGTAVGALSTFVRDSAGMWSVAGARFGTTGNDGELGHVHPPIDWDGDGAQDLVVGTPGFDVPDAGTTDAGLVEIFFGPEFTESAAVRIVGRSGSLLGSR